MPYQPPDCDTAVPKNNNGGSGQYNSSSDCHRSMGNAKPNGWGGSRRRRRPSRKYKKSAKRVFRKKSRSTRRR